jgi:choline dehydrogenase
MASADTSADVLVIGGGAAGAIVAAKLSEDPSRRVILLEAGGQGALPVYRVPVMTGFLAQSRFGVWADETAPEPNLEGRRIPWPHGRVLGGSAAINGMVWMRGRASDFDRWAASGLRNWSGAAVERAYAELEAASDRRSDGSGLPITHHAGDNPLYRTFVEAGLQAGHPHASDFNRGLQEGVGRMSVNIADGQRQSSARIFLEPARGRTNLRVITRATVSRLRLDGRRIVGATAKLRGNTVEFSADRVVLCGGTVNSPQLLLLSGIGPAKDLLAQRIPVIHDLPGVGQNLQDHVCVRVAYECREPITLHSLARADRALLGFLEAWLHGTGPAATTPFGAGFLLRSGPGEREPDLEGVFLPVLATARLWFPVLRPAPSGHGFVGTVYPLRPESRGHIGLRSADPADRPIIVANYLSAPEDRRRMRSGVRLMQNLFAQPAFERYRGRSLFPEWGTDEAALDAAIARTASSAYHPVGSCKMGLASDPLAVVDERLRVHGLEGLHVADASIMPTLTSGNTNAPSMMIGLRCAEFLRSE